MLNKIIKYKTAKLQNCKNTKNAKMQKCKNTKNTKLLKI